ncbi:MAG: nucleoside 2-deoxyribosyltransferase [Proteobacteria bacterium]|nr:nucleoside 2-deoxyribosyltransferase [Pseudomonadota bacterium]
MRIYIAHPAFIETQREFKHLFIAKLNGELHKLTCQEPITLVDPFNYSPTIEGNTAEKIALAKEVKGVCLDLLDHCDLLIAVVDGDDTGTAFEAGYAYHMGIPVVLVSQGSCSSANAMLLGSAQAVVDNILDGPQISRLVELIKTRYSSPSKSSSLHKYS